jgi:hypothetical protein
VRFRRAWSAALAIQFVAPILFPLTASSQDERSGAPSLPEEPAAPVEEPANQNQLLEERIAELNHRLTLAEERQNRPSPLSWNGYVDFGFFAPLGNRGVGWVQDLNNTQFPQYSNFAWTFLGDILATTVNTRGEAADLGNESAPGPIGANRFDSINSDGAAGFIVNEVNLRPKYSINDNAVVRTSLNFAPRSGDNYALGDSVDVDLAELEYVLTRDGKTSIFAGKTLPVFGIEYKERKSDQRFGITPSLIGRYTMGPQLGLKIRSKLLNDWLILAAAVTNNSSVIEPFHFYNEIDKNRGKTLNGRAAISIPVGQLWRNDDRLELGASGEWGPQDRATNNDGKMWFLGGDLQMLGTNYALKAQVMRGASPGLPEQGVWKLDLNTSGYAMFEWMFLPQLGFLVRGEVRDAIVSLGTERIYVTKQARGTVGLRLVVNQHVFMKVEYLHNREYGGIGEFDNNIFTSSLVLAL